MITSKLSAEFLRDLMDGSHVLIRDGDRFFPHVDEIVIHGDEVDLRYNGKSLITYDLAGYRAQRLSLGLQVKLGD